jgi:hypothetical protein
MPQLKKIRAMSDSHWKHPRGEKQKLKKKKKRNL